MSDLTGELEELRGVLESVIGRLDDLAFRELRQAVARGDKARPLVERRITRARNAVIRAMGLLITDDENEID